MRMETVQKAQWYIIYTYNNTEKRVKEQIEHLAKTKYKGLILKAEIPTSIKTINRNGKNKQVEEKVFPRYVFVKAVLTNEVRAAIKSINGVQGFVGPAGEPTPITSDEVVRAGIRDSINDEFKVGDTVMIADGPFENFLGRIEKIEGRKINISLNIFGREVGIDFSPEQVMKIQ